MKTRSENPLFEFETEGRGARSNEAYALLSCGNNLRLLNLRTFYEVDITNAIGYREFSRTFLSICQILDMPGGCTELIVAEALGAATFTVQSSSDDTVQIMMVIRVGLEVVAVGGPSATSVKVTVSALADPTAKDPTAKHVRKAQLRTHVADAWIRPWCRVLISAPKGGTGVRSSPRSPACCSPMSVYSKHKI